MSPSWPKRMSSLLALQAMRSRILFKARNPGRGAFEAARLSRSSQASECCTKACPKCGRPDHPKRPGQDPYFCPGLNGWKISEPRLETFVSHTHSPPNPHREQDVRREWHVWPVYKLRSSHCFRIACNPLLPFFATTVSRQLE